MWNIETKIEFGKELHPSFLFTQSLVSKNWFPTLSWLHDLEGSSSCWCLWSVWPEKNCQKSIKVVKNDLTRKMIDFNTFTKIASDCRRFVQINCCQRLWKVAQSPINCTVCSHCLWWWWWCTICRARKREREINVWQFYFNFDFKVAKMIVEQRQAWRCVKHGSSLKLRIAVWPDCASIQTFWAHIFLPKYCKHLVRIWPIL